MVPSHGQLGEEPGLGLRPGLRLRLSAFGLGFGFRLDFGLAFGLDFWLSGLDFAQDFDSILI